LARGLRRWLSPRVYDGIVKKRRKRSEGKERGREEREGRRDKRDRGEKFCVVNNTPTSNKTVTVHFAV
jgi:hypothetical protein